VVWPFDGQAALKARLKSYDDKTIPVLEHYMPTGVVTSVNGNQAGEMEPFVTL
jgi:adenylate kinase family enzyme